MTCEALNCLFDGLPGSEGVLKGCRGACGGRGGAVGEGRGS